MSKCIPKILVQGTHINLTMCSSCKRIGLYYKNILSGFDPAQFSGFAESVINISFQKYAVPFPPQGDLRIVLKTCHEDIQFSFNSEEYIELKNSLQEAQLLIEVEKVLE